MLTSINEFKKKLDKVGKEDIDINNDGKVDKSDFFLLGRRRKIKKAIKDKKNKKNKKNENVSSNPYQRAMQIFFDFNLLTELMDEGYIDTEVMELAEGVTLEDINDSKTVEEPPFASMEEFNIFLARCNKYLDVE